MKKIFFISYGGGHVKMLLPIINRFLDSDEYDVVVFGLTTAGSVLRQHGIPFISFKDFASEDEKKLGYKLIENSEVNNLVDPEESASYHGINFAELVETHGLELAKNLWSSSGRQSFFPINFFQNFFKNHLFDLIVSTNSPRSERAALEAARSLGISSFCIVDMFALQEISWLKQEKFATKFCVLNENVRQFFISEGIEPDTVIVTGNPAFDTIFDEVYKAESLRLRSSYCTHDNDIVVVYASQPEPLNHPFCDRIGDVNLPSSIELYLRNFIKDNANFKLVIRYHPSQTCIFTEQNNVFFSPISESLYSLLHAADIVVVTASTVGLEASLIGKPVISVDLSIFTPDAPFSRMGISYGISSIEELGSSLLFFTKNSVANCFNNDVRLNAAENISYQIKTLLGMS